MKKQTERSNDDFYDLFNDDGGIEEEEKEVVVRGRKFKTPEENIIKFKKKKTFKE